MIKDRETDDIQLYYYYRARNAKTYGLVWWSVLLESQLC
jgi:hypothetical protein